MANRLARERSPYLLQHRNNPVDWYPWGDEAFEKAAREDKPIFLSVGYSSCHWCHVMEHESFEDPEIAAFLNQHFVSVKVDREERPDIDDTYMTAVQMQSGRGGWPMSVFMRPDKKPFFAGTYFPKNDRPPYPGFGSVLRQIVALWSERRDTVDEASNAFAEQLAVALEREAPKSFAQLDRSLLEATIQALAADFDRENGGFGAAPKFPPHSAVEYLLAVSERPEFPAETRELALQIATMTLERMAMGGLHDQIGGGFHRYSTDESWLLPHFEKMLYDNALLLSAYAKAAKRIESEQPERAAYFREVAAGVVRWAKREMQAEDGTFYAALDADTEGEEGAAYVWTVAEIMEALGDKGEVFIFNYRFEEDGNYLDEATREATGANIPHLRHRLDALSRDVLDQLLKVRNTRPQPARDDKSLVGWNGLMIAGLVDAGEVAVAKVAADAILHVSDGGRKLPRYLHGGEPVGKAFLEDKAAFAVGLLKLVEAGHPAYLSAAEHVLRHMNHRFYDGVQGGYFATADDHETLFGKIKPVFDQPIPSGNALALKAMLMDSALRRDPDLHADRIEKTLGAMLGWMERAPQATEAIAWGALEFLHRKGALNAEAPALKPMRVEAVVTPRELVAGDDGWAEGAVTIMLPDGVHINGPVPLAKWLIPTQVSVEGLEYAVDYPSGDEFGYENDVRIGFRVRHSRVRDVDEAEVSLTYQACTATECLEPETVKFAILVRAKGARL